MDLPTSWYDTVFGEGQQSYGFGVEDGKANTGRGVK